MFWKRKFRKLKVVRIRATLDDEVQVWVATSDDIPGLVTEAQTAEELKAKLQVIIPELIEENGLSVQCRASGIPFSLHGELLAQGMAPCPTSPHAEALAQNERLLSQAPGKRGP